MIKASTDSTTDVESAFQELECCFKPENSGPHGGDTVALYTAHGCFEGWVCKNHLDFYVNVLRPQHRMLNRMVALTCAWCRERFENYEDFSKVWVI